MTFGSVCIAFKEERYIVPHLKHLPDWIDEKIVLSSTQPWFGENVGLDKTAELAKPHARVIEAYWEDESSQRNTGQAIHEDKDWVVVLDPDEFIDDENWAKLKDFLEKTTANAVVVEGQYTYWKEEWVASPPIDYQMLVAVRPKIKFVDKRIVGSDFVVAPVWLHHMSWRRTDEEVWNKISHYAHAHDFDIKHWYESVWKPWKPGIKDTHPVTPETLHDFKKAKLPPELKKLGI